MTEAVGRTSRASHGVLGYVLWVSAILMTGMVLLAMRVLNASWADLNPLAESFGIGSFVAFVVLFAAAVEASIGTLLILRGRRFGTATLEVGSVRLGETLKGVLRPERPIQPTGHFVFTLTCERATTSAGETHHEQLWEGTTRVHRDKAAASNAIAFEIALPSEGPALPTTPQQVTWSLRVNAPASPLNFTAAFEVVVDPRPSDRPLISMLADI